MRSPIEIRLSGPGLHDGIPARLELSIRPQSVPRIRDSDHPDHADPGSGPPGADGLPPDPGGIRFLLPGENGIAFEELRGWTREASRSTVLRRPIALTGSAAPHGLDADPPMAAAVLKTPEHLLASLLFFSEMPLDIRCDAAEIPGLDGSALPFREALARLAPERAARPAWRGYRCDLSWEHRWSYGWMRVRPASRFRVRFELDRPPLRQAFVLEDAATAWSQILPARTFAFHREWKQASSQGLMSGAGVGSGLLLAESREEHAALLISLPGSLPAPHPHSLPGADSPWRGGPFPLLNQPAWRMEDEPVKHKILDLIGDLALIGPAGPALPALDIEILNGGHRINHLLIDQILAARG
jgi:UDP-3-O-[3-hydroxymyristoyl] N-acetylglucosamine deacetylase